MQYTSSDDQFDFHKMLQTDEIKQLSMFGDHNLSIIEEIDKKLSAG